MSWYDTVFLPLAVGDNDLAITVSEDFGGWGVQARFDDREGIELLSESRAGTRLDGSAPADGESRGTEEPCRSRTFA